MARYIVVFVVVVPAVLLATVMQFDLSLAQWLTNGIPLCDAEEDQNYPQVVSAGDGGSIAVWQDDRNGDWDIYAQKVDTSGAVLWDSIGVAICTAHLDQMYPQLVSNGAGGAIIAWTDCRSDYSSWDIYAQAVDSAGLAYWPADGVAICAAHGDQKDPQLAADGLGGAIIAWQDERSEENWDIYMQWVDALGAAQWDFDGVPICTASCDQESPQIISDDVTGAILTWQDWRTGSHYDIYAYLWTVGEVAVCTEPGDQMYPQLTSDGGGGAIFTWEDRRGDELDVYAQHVSFSGSLLWDSGGVAICTTSGYQAFPRLVSDEAGGAIIAWCGREIRAQRVSPLGTWLWDFNGVEICPMWDEQWAVVQLISDGAGGAIATWPDYRYGYAYVDIYAQRLDPSGEVLWEDNGAAICTETSACQYYPQLATDGDQGAIVVWMDQRGPNADIYALRVDQEGNAPPVDVPWNCQEPTAPRAFSLSQNCPNPFNPMTEISYALPVDCRVTLEIYNVLGQRVTTLVDEKQHAGHRSVHWDATLHPSGIYFCCISAGDFVETKRMVLIK